MNDTIKWICCQIGSREHYAIPRALRRSGLLDAFITDAWAPPGRWASRLGMGGRLSQRYSAELSNAKVNDFTWSLLAFECGLRLRRNSGWQRIIARNEWFQQKTVRQLQALNRAGALAEQKQPKILFCYSYAAREIFRFAKEKGWYTVLGQIDPGPEEEGIVKAEVGRNTALDPSWHPAPVHYWQKWRDECALADLILVNSRWSYEALNTTGVPTGKLRIVPLAYEGPQNFDCSEKFYPARFTREEPLKVLFLGQVNLRKGIARLLRAAEILADEPVELSIVGPDQVPGFRQVRRTCEIRWHGPVSREEAGRFYRQSHVFILPTLSDGFAITQLEAMSYGLPVISSRFCGEVVEDGITGIALEEVTPTAIAHAVRVCLSNPSMLKGFSRTASQRKGFGLDGLSSHLLSLSRWGNQVQNLVRGE